MDTLYIVIGLGLAFVFILIMNGSSAPEPPPENISDDDIREIARNGEKIKAIKWYRDLHGVDLRTAKDAVEALMKK